MGIKIEKGASRVVAETGAERQYAEGKGLPASISPIALRELAIHIEDGCKRYHVDNWRKGLPLRSIMDSLLRHVFAELSGWDDESHDRAILWNAMAYIHTKREIEAGRLPAMLNNMPAPLPPKQEENK